MITVPDKVSARPCRHNINSVRNKNYLITADSALVNWTKPYPFKRLDPCFGRSRFSIWPNLSRIPITSSWTMFSVVIHKIPLKNKPLEPGRLFSASTRRLVAQCDSVRPTEPHTEAKWAFPRPSAHVASGPSRRPAGVSPRFGLAM